MTPQVNLDGALIPEDEATVSIHDRGFRYGDGAFETMRAYGGTIFAWDAHASRLASSCETLGFGGALPDRTELRRRIDATLDANDLTEAYVRLTISRGADHGKLTPPSDPDPTVVVVTRELPRGGPDGEPVWDGPATLQTVRTRRIPDNALPTDAKTLNYLNGILARLELQRAATAEYDADEAIMRDIEGRVLEGATSNIFAVVDGQLITPPADADLLAGITRQIVLELARDEEFPVLEQHLDIETLRQANEAFLTNSTWEIRPVETIDGLGVGGGPITELLRHRYAERVATACYD
ncbi:MAG: aminotransferase class IV [Salinirussus sp.]